MVFDEKTLERDNFEESLLIPNLLRTLERITVDKRLELLKKKKEKLERVKKGLMNDLLTGKRRVTNFISKEEI